MRTQIIFPVLRCFSRPLRPSATIATHPSQWSNPIQKPPRMGIAGLPVPNLRFFLSNIYSTLPCLNISSSSGLRKLRCLLAPQRLKVVAAEAVLPDDNIAASLPFPSRAQLRATAREEAIKRVTSTMARTCIHSLYEAPGREAPTIH